MVALSIRHGFDGTSHDFYIERSWRYTPKGVVESLQVTRDGIPDEDLSNNWLEYVDHFVPVGLAELFFFDGEKLEQIAQSNNAAKMLSTAINSLLGLDLVDRLEKDLVVYEKDLAKKRKTKDELNEVEVLESELKSLEAELKDLYQGARTKAIGRVDSSQKRRENAVEEFEKHGGEVFKNREAIETQKSMWQEEIKRVEEHMRETAAGTLPLLLLKDEIEAVVKQADLENSAENNALLQDALQEQKQNLTKQLKKWKAERDLTERISDYLDNEITKLRSTDAATSYLKLDKTEYNSLKNLDNNTFDLDERNADSLVKRFDRLEEEIQQINDQLSRVPDDQAIADFARELSRAEAENEKAKADLAIVEETIGQRSRAIAEAKRKIHKLLDKNIDQLTDSERIDRKIRYAEKVRNTMRRFKATVLERKIRLIEELILDSFRQLLRKKNLLTAIKIDPETYNMSLVGRHGEDVPPNSLSAGERQLLAVSTLWGLAKATGRPMPNVIDTPMARLDSEHRTHLVENYFPNASHQVVILSTDEEIDEKYYPKIKSRVSRSYQLSYCDEAQSTVIKEGYFFN